MRGKSKILIAGLIGQEPKILKEYLISLEKLEKENLRVDYYFAVYTSNQDSIRLLQDFESSIILSKGAFAQKRNKVVIKKISDGSEQEGEGEEYRGLTGKLADIKNGVMRYCRRNIYDYLLMTEGDMILHPATVKNLIYTGKDIVSEFVLTRWGADEIEPPDILLCDPHTAFGLSQVEKHPLELFSGEKEKFSEKLKEPGVYEAGSITSCALMSKKALQRGISFKKIHQIEFWGKDHSFMLKARILGFSLYLDTAYPSYRLLHESDRESWDAVRSRERTSAANANTPSTWQSGIYTTLESFIKEYLSCDYRIVTGFEGYRYMSRPFVEKLTERQDEMVETLAANEVICSAHCTNIHLVLTEPESGAITAKVDFVLEFTKKQLKYDKKMQCEIAVLKEQDLLWKINAVLFKNQRGRVLLGSGLSDLINEKEKVLKYKNNKVTLLMLINGGAGNMWKKALSHAVGYMDNAIIMDAEASGDIGESCKEILKNIPVNMIRSPNTRRDKQALWKQLWDMAVDSASDWILCLDQDEYFEEVTFEVMDKLINQPYFDYYTFPVSTWSKGTNIYRDEIRLIRFQPEFPYVWEHMDGGNERLPGNIRTLEGSRCEILLKHY